MHKILFVCTGNQYRSPIAAEAFRSQLAQDGSETDWLVTSAGTWTTPGQPAPPDAIEIARSHDLLIDMHRTRRLAADMLKEADIVIVMEEGHRDAIRAEFPFARAKVHLLSQVLEGIVYDIPDPAASKEETREILGELIAMIQADYLKICRMVQAD
jgi:protein-tyrosine phosphatase